MIISSDEETKKKRRFRVGLTLFQNWLNLKLRATWKERHELCTKKTKTEIN